MKNLLLYSLILFCCCTGPRSGAILSETQKFSSLCKVWGFLKYYHPIVAEGKWDWDSVLLKKIHLVEKANTEEELNDIYINWIRELGDVKKYKRQKSPQTATPKNRYLQWLDDREMLTNEVIAELLEVKIRRNIGPGHYIKPTEYTNNAEFTNEKEYPEAIFPDKYMRLLTMFRYWNMVEYYYPYKYLMDKDWAETLNELIPEFYSAPNALAYEAAIKKLVAGLNDSHANIGLPERTKRFKYAVPFVTKIIDGKAVVTTIIDEERAKINDIRYGDVITAINDTSVNDLIALLKPYAGASNNAVVLRNIATMVSVGSTDTVTMTYERNGISYKRKIARYDMEKYDRRNYGDTTVHGILPGNIGYVNLGILKSTDDIKKLLDGMMNTKAIILDVRNYPDGTMYTICSILSSKKTDFVKFTSPDYSCPGTFKNEPPYACGTNNKDHYKGKIIVLMNEQTQSHAEFTCMSFKTLPNTTFIGSQTAGADGNVSFITLPGGSKTYITGIGIYYPDGTETQRIGIVPDIEIHPTIKGIQEHRDEVLERAISFINTGK